MKFQIINKVIPDQSPEDDTGNREYKLYLAHGYVIGQPIEKAAKSFNDNIKNGKVTRRMRKSQVYTSEADKYNRRATQLLYRLAMGGGTALYIIGISDCGHTCGIYLPILIKSLIYLFEVANIAKVSIKAIRIYRGQKEYSFIATIRLEQTTIFDNYLL
jgi:hypothetical protein